MDDFLSKPIRGASLEVVLDRWVSRHAESTGRTVEQAAPGDPAEDGVGTGKALPPGSVGCTVQLDRDASRPIWELEEIGKPGLFDEMLGLFRREGGERIVEIRTALARDDAQVVYRLAHTMKGEALAWGATELVDASRRLEERSRDGSRAELAGLLADLERLFEATVAALHAVRLAPVR